MNVQNIAAGLIIFVITIIALIYGQSLLQPFVLGLLFWFILRGIKKNLEGIPFIQKRFPSWLKTGLAAFIVLGVLVVISRVLTTNINSLALSYEKYQPNVDSILQQINELFNINVVEYAQAHLGDLNFGTILSSIFNSLSDLIGNSFMIVLYAAFILLEESNFESKLRAVFSDNANYANFSSILRKIEASISSYFGLKMVVSLITGVLSYMALLMIGVDSPAFWAFLIFILNFIPTIGSLIGTVFPAIFSLLQFGELWPCLLVLLIVGVIQLIVGNILEPRLMGSSMNISPLVTILSLSFWGAVWGIIGMILSVPIAVILIIICSQFARTRPLAIMLSEKGEIDDLHQA